MARSYRFAADALLSECSDRVCCPSSSPKEVVVGLRGRGTCRVGAEEVIRPAAILAEDCSPGRSCPSYVLAFFGEILLLSGSRGGLTPALLASSPRSTILVAYLVGTKHTTLVQLEKVDCGIVESLRPARMPDFPEVSKVDMLQHK